MKSIDAAVVTLFNPQESFIKNIFTYLPFVNELIIIDNSDVPQEIHSLYLQETPIKILSQGKNLGIAKSFNLALSYAKSKNYQWLLTMDQDSSFEHKEIVKFASFFKDIAKDKLGIFTPLHNKNFLLSTDQVFNRNNNYVMTSANIISVNKALEVGGFDENLFIDEVDHDFCFKLLQHDYRIVQNYNCYINHNLGEKHARSNVTLYSYHRIYYMVRNYLYMRKKYKHQQKSFFSERDVYLTKFILKQLLYGKEKRKSLVMVYAGIQDYKQNKMGYRVQM